MTIEKFNETKFTGNMKVVYRGKEHELMSVDFQEKLIAINVEYDEDLHWLRCENVEIISN